MKNTNAIVAKRLIIVVAMFGLITCFSSLESQELETTKPVVGVVFEKPTEGLFVPIDSGKKGYMIPYLQNVVGQAVQIKMIPIPGGRARLGKTESTEIENSKSENIPRYEVELEPMWVSETEITWNQYQPYMRFHDVLRNLQINERNTPAHHTNRDAVTAPTPLYSPETHKEFSPSKDHPAVTMTQYAAKQYTKWLSKKSGLQYRLPTEAEWEYAARSGSETRYCFGNNEQELTEYAVHSNQQTQAAVVRTKRPNAFGLFDMHGNVWEWTTEMDSSNYLERNGKTLKGWEGTNWPDKMEGLVARGGSWADSAEQNRVTARIFSNLVDWSSDDPELPTSPWWHTSDPATRVGMRIFRSCKDAPLQDMERFWNTQSQELIDNLQMTLHEGRGRAGMVEPDKP